MDIRKYQDLYERADNLPKKTERGNTYGSNLGKKIIDVLMDFKTFLLRIMKQL